MSEDFCEVDCPACGIKFKFTKKIEEMWRESGKTFYCPNGHTLNWSKPKESPEQKELKQLRSEVKELKEKLATSEKQTEDHKRRVDELTAELEIWRPSTTEEQKAG